MRKLKVFFFVAFCCGLEFPVIFLGILAYLIFPESLKIFQTELKNSLKIPEYIGLAPITALFYLLKEVKKMHFHHNDEKKKTLQGWPKHWRLKIYTFTTLYYAIIFAIFGVISFFLVQKDISPLGITFFIIGIIGALVNALSFYQGKFQQDELM